MEMQRTSDVLRELLVRQGMTRVAVGAADTRGMSAQPVGAGAASVKGPDPKARPVYREVVKLNRAGEKPSGIAFEVHTNLDVPTSTRKRTARVPFLVLVK